MLGSISVRELLAATSYVKSLMIVAIIYRRRVPPKPLLSYRVLLGAGAELDDPPP